MLNCAKIPQIVLCWKSQLRVDFQIESVLGYYRKNPNREKNKKSPRIFRFVTLSLEIPSKMKIHHCKFCKMDLHPLEFQVKNQDPWKFDSFFWMILRNSTCFLLKPEISTFYFLIICKFHVFKLVFLNFFWNSPLKVRRKK